MRTLALWVLGIPFVFAMLGIAFDNPKGTPAWVAKTMVSNIYVVSDFHYREKRKAMGTGFFIDDRYVVTNCHVASQFMTVTWDDGVQSKDYRSLRLTGVHGQDFEAEVVACNEKHDLALLKTRWPNHEAKELKIDWRSLKFGEAIYSSGYGFNMPLTPKMGWAGELLGHRGVLAQHMTMPIAPGDSGSPIFDKWGNVRGVAYRAFMMRISPFTAAPIADRSIAIPSFILKQFLLEHGVYHGN